MRPKPLMPQGTADMEVGMVRAAAEPMARASTTAENYDLDLQATEKSGGNQN
jgi:hypothetical protein